MKNQPANRDSRPVRWSWRAAVLIGTLAALIAVAVSVAGPAAASPPPGSLAPLKDAAAGIDVSASQHKSGAPIVWPTVAGAGYRFAFIKVTEGNYYVNPYFSSDFAAAKAAGMPVAAYHFANPAASGGAQQAGYAIDHGAYQSDGSTLPLALDIEYDPYSPDWCYGLTQSRMVSWVAAFVNEAQRRTGVAPVIYTPGQWWDKCAGSSEAFGTTQVWAPDYTSGAKVPSLPAAGWRNWTFWQYTSSGAVPGISVQTDLSQLSPDALQVAAPADQAYPTGHTVSVRAPATVAAPGLTLRYSASGLPAGLSVDPATGTISGKLPDSPREQMATLTVTGAGLPSVSARFAWHVHGAVSLTAPAALTSQAGRPVSRQITANDSLPGCTLRFTATGLPPGAAISQCGQLTGSPASPGSYHPVVEVTDSTGAMLASASFGWRVTRSRGGR